MRPLQDISVFEGIDTPVTGFPGNWTVLTSDSSIQILNLDNVPSDDISLYPDETFKPTNKFASRAVQLPTVKSIDTSDKPTNNKLDSEYMRKTYVSLDSVFDKRDTLSEERALLGNAKHSRTCVNNSHVHGRNVATHNGLSVKAWSSDSRLSCPIVEEPIKFKQFSSTGDIVSKIGYGDSEVKPILSTKKKRGSRVKKTVSFKDSEAETRFYVKCEFGEDSEKVTDTEKGLYSLFVPECTTFQEKCGVGYGYNNVTRDLIDYSEETFVRKPVLPSCQTKVAKVVKCRSIIKSSDNKKLVDKETPRWRQRIISATKRKLAQFTNDHVSSDVQSDKLSLENMYPELVDKIPKFSCKTGRNHTDLEPLSKFLMENNGMESISNVKSTSLSKSCPNIFKDEKQEQGVNYINSPDKNDGFNITPFRTGTADLRSLRCQRRLSFNESLNEANILDIDGIHIEQINTFNKDIVKCQIPENNKPVRPRLGVQCKLPKPVELDNLDIDFVCDMKKKIAKSNRNMKIKTNGSLRLTQGTTGKFSSPRNKCLSKIGRSPPLSIRMFKGASRLESCV